MTILTLACDTDTHSTRASSRTAHTTTVIAPQGSALEARLRTSGWVARSGWVSNAGTERSMWLVRYERPETPASDVDA